jgi:crossover junction endodeoxyribonuclease RuvC
MRTVLAADLSLSCPALAVLEFDGEGVKVKELYHVKTNTKKTINYRLFEIYNLVDEIYKKHEITDVVMEKGFQRHAIATQQLQRVVGVFLLISFYYGFDKVEEVAPTSVKKLVTGDGKASKEELASALVNYVGEIEYKTNDESDSVGVGIALGKQKGWLL